MNVTYDGFIDHYHHNQTSKEVVVCVFETRQHGYVQFGQNNRRLVEYSAEPSIHNFTKDEQEYIKTIMTIVHRLVFDGPKPETLK